MDEKASTAKDDKNSELGDLLTEQREMNQKLMARLDALEKKPARRKPGRKPGRKPSEKGEGMAVVTSDDGATHID